MISFQFVWLFEFYLLTSTCCGVLGEYYFLHKLSMENITYHIIYIVEEMHKEYQRTNFDGDGKVAILLNESLAIIPIDPEGSYMSISGFPNSSWQTDCKAFGANFNCHIQAMKLEIVIFHRNAVNKFQTKYLFNIPALYN